MPITQNNQPRFHYDPQRETSKVPSLSHLQHWCMERLTSPEGGNARECVRVATLQLAERAERDEVLDGISVATARAVRTAARDIHDVAREFGFDPTTHEATREACGQMCLARISAEAGCMVEPDDAAEAVRTVAGELLRLVLVTAEAMALTALAMSMIRTGGSSGDLHDAVRDDAQPETIAILDAVWATAKRAN